MGEIMGEKSKPIILEFQFMMNIQTILDGLKKKSRVLATKAKQSNSCN